MIHDKSLEVRGSAAQTLQDGREKLDEVKMDVRWRISNLESVAR
jgi:hypothetical protein